YEIATLLRTLPNFFVSTTLTADKFTTLSGSMVGTADGGIRVSVPRLRAVLKQPLIARSINYHFRITGPTSTIKVDSDGVTRMGVTLWANVINACNLDFLSCRTDDRVG